MRTLKHSLCESKRRWTADTGDAHHKQPLLCPLVCSSTVHPDGNQRHDDACSTDSMLAMTGTQRIVGLSISVIACAALLVLGIIQMLGSQAAP